MKNTPSIKKNREIQYQFQSMFLNMYSFQKQFDEIDRVFQTLKIPDILSSKCIFYQDMLSGKLMDLNFEISKLQVKFLDSLCLDVTTHFESKLARSKVLEECEAVMDREFEERTILYEKLRRKIVPVQIRNKTLKIIENFTKKFFRANLPSHYEDISKWQLHKKKMILKEKKREMQQIQKLSETKLSNDPHTQIDNLRRLLYLKTKKVYLGKMKRSQIVILTINNYFLECEQVKRK